MCSYAQVLNVLFSVAVASVRPTLLCLFFLGIPSVRMPRMPGVHLALGCL